MLSIIGSGFVGSAVYHGFSPYFKIKIYDKFKQGYHELDETVNHSRFIFVCVPTPVTAEGKQDISSLENAIQSIVGVANERKIIVIKSTSIPGTTRYFAEKYKNHGFIFNPEFLTERNAIMDFINSYRVILGGLENDVDDLETIYRVRFPHALIMKGSWEEAELIKYILNCFFATKVSIMNEVYDICRGMSIDYENIRKMFLADQRVGNSHTQVPGFDGYRGFGGKCFPKDLKSFVSFCKEKNLPCEMFATADLVNEKVREYKDWLEIKGATSDNNYC